MIEFGNERISVVRQCELLGLARSTLYYRPKGICEGDLELMRRIDEQYTHTPFYGSCRMKEWPRRQGYEVDRKNVMRLIKQMGLEAIYPKPRLSKPARGHKIHPYLLRGVIITRPDQVWASDITYIRLRRGFVYLVVVINWFTRYVLAWEVSISLEADFCITALQRALLSGEPEIFNTNQGAQFTSDRFLEVLEDCSIRISMNGRGRAVDNIFVERLGRASKYDEVYLKDYESVIEAVEGLGDYFRFYNCDRLHQSLAYRVPAELYYGRAVDIKDTDLKVLEGEY